MTRIERATATGALAGRGGVRGGRADDQGGGCRDGSPTTSRVRRPGPGPVGLRADPRRYYRGLNRVFYDSAMISIRTCPESKKLYDRKRAEGKKHTQAVLALARRRINVIWALLRDDR